MKNIVIGLFAVSLVIGIYIFSLFRQAQVAKIHREGILTSANIEGVLVRPVAAKKNQSSLNGHLADHLCFESPNRWNFRGTPIKWCEVSVNYVFKDERGGSIQGSWSFISKDQVKFAVGDSLKIRYLKEDPSQNTVEGQ